MISDQSLQRATLLYQHSRYSEAEQELRRVLAEQPQDPRAHALLALCVLKQERLEEAQSEVEQAVSLAPDWPRAHYCRSIVLDYRNRFEEAEAAAREAARLDPAEAEYYGRLAATLYNQRRWSEALEAAEQGLQYDAEHSGCGHLRTMALTKLGRKREALANVDESLARDPDDAFAHSNKGWALLYEGKPRPALEHFREALRLDPTLEYARQGMVEALKAQRLVYRFVLGYFLWMARLGSRAQWAIVIGGYIGYQLLRNLIRNDPQLAPWIVPLLVLYVVFALLTWFATPLFNLLLRFNRFGRHALSRDMRVASNWFAGCLAAFVAGAAVFMKTGGGAPFVLAVISIGLGLPLTTIYRCDVGWPRRAMAWYTAGLAALGGIALLGASYEDLTARSAPWDSVGVYKVFLWGVLLSPWAANYLAGVIVRR